MKIISEDEYDQALKRLDNIFHVTEDDPEWQEHLDLVDAIVTYEKMVYGNWESNYD